MMTILRVRIMICLLALLLAIIAVLVEATTKGGPRLAKPIKGLDWNSFGFSLNDVETNFMWMQRIPVPASVTDGCSSSSSIDEDNNEDGGDSDSSGDGDDENIAQFDPNTDKNLQPFSELKLSPASTALNYGQSLFEGMKAFRRADGTVSLFRPEMNAKRMQQGADRFLLPQVPTDVFVHAADAVVRANAAFVPPYKQGALYLRPLLMGTGAELGVKPSTEATFCVWCSPVGNYFKAGLTAIHLQAVAGFSRAAIGGSGHIKAAGNYAPAFRTQSRVRRRGYDEAICLDAATGQAVEEAGASNFFAVYYRRGGGPNGTVAATLVTPSLESQTILPGVTRTSIIELAEKELGCRVVEGRLTLNDLKRADEAFCCGTGACITPVGSVSVHSDGRGGDNDRQDARQQLMITFGDGHTVGEVTRRLYDMLTGIQTGSADVDLCEKYSHWVHVVEPRGRRLRLWYLLVLSCLPLLQILLSYFLS